jgi:outer membrane protein OmpA-like peptidoglycan-associated protein
MDGQIIRQSSSYRQGLVLGLTMAEIMILLVFCLLIAMAAFLRVEHDKRELAEKELGQERAARNSERDLVSTVKQNLVLLDRLRDAVGSNDPGAVDEYWRELVESHAIVAKLTNNGLPVAQLSDRVIDAANLKARGIDAETALRDEDIVASIEKALPNVRDRAMGSGAIADIVARGLQPPSNPGHQWPPIIKLSEAAGYHFNSGSAELSQRFRSDLTGPIPAQILELIKQYDVDVIEVVGHTDEQPVGTRESNLDRELLPVLRNSADIASVVPADNAGLGLARAVSVVSVLLQNKALSGYKLLPLSGAQLINNDETLAISGTPGDVLERRRIEIRLRKSTPSDSPAEASPYPPDPGVMAQRPRQKSAVPARKPLALFPND